MTVLRESDGVSGDGLAHDEVVEGGPSIAGSNPLYRAVQPSARRSRLGV
jgi:hypothetical protein